MLSTTIQKRISSFLMHVTGFSPYLLAKCSEDFQLRIRGLGAKLLFTSTVSATIMSLVFSLIILRTWTVFPLIFFSAFGIYFFFDSMIISGRKSQTLIIMRFIAIVVISLLNTILLDTVLFRKDIRQAFTENRNMQKEKIEGEFHQLRNEHLHRISDHRSAQQKLRDSIAMSLYIPLDESDGRGGSKQAGVGEIAKYKERIVERMNAGWYQAIAVIDGYIEDENNALEAIETKRQEQLTTLPEWSEAGLLQHIEWLHHLLITQKNVLLMIFSLCWLVFFAILEALPLLGRNLCDFSEYEQMRTAWASERTQSFLQQLKYEADINLQKIVAEYQHVINKMRAANYTAKSLQVLDEILHMYKVEMDTIIELANEEKRLNDQLTEQYVNLANMARKRAFQRIDLWQHDESSRAA